jgi:hypothetical protein
MEAPMAWFRRDYPVIQWSFLGVGGFPRRRQGIGYRSSMKLFSG